MEQETLGVEMTRNVVGGQNSYVGKSNYFIDWIRHTVRNEKARFHRAFPGRVRFYGAWNNFEEATKAIPKHKLAGYNHKELSTIGFEEMSSVLPWDYPVIYWLSRILNSDSILLDAGGHMGTKFRAFSSYVEIIPSVRWVVYDLPKIAEEGRRLAAQNGLSSLEFISDLSDAPNADILLASGLLQYVDQSLGDLLNCLPARSKYVLLNKVAVRDGERVVTLENFDFAVVPYHIRSRAELFADIDAAGYDILDQWTIPSLSHAIPTHPNLGRSESLGFCLRAR